MLALLGCLLIILANVFLLLASNMRATEQGLLHSLDIGSQVQDPALLPAGQEILLTKRSLMQPEIARCALWQRFTLDNMQTHDKRPKSNVRPGHG